VKWGLALVSINNSWLASFSLEVSFHFTTTFQPGLSGDFVDSQNWLQRVENRHTVLFIELTQNLKNDHAKDVFLNTGLHHQMSR
jgi:hypothetical protein